MTFDRDLGSGLLNLRRCHLTGDRTLPDQFVECELITFQRLLDTVRRERWVSRTDSFVGFLSILRFRFVLARRCRQIAPGILSFNKVADLGDGFRYDLNAIRSHVGNEADGLATDINAFIKTLGHLHCLFG